MQVHLSWADDDATALAIAHDQWRTNVFATELMWELELPEPVRRGRAATCAPTMCARPVMISADPGPPRRCGSGSVAGLGVDTLLPAPRRHEQRPVHRGVRRARPAAGGLVTSARTSDLWWKNAVIYCLDVETFLDWNDDGMGTWPGSPNASTTSPASA